MYKYFMGKISNLKSKATNAPIVIAIDNPTSKLLNSWLDYYVLDFDRFIEGLKHILKVEIKNITFESKDNLALHLEDGSIAFIILLHEQAPKCVIHIRKDEYTFDFQKFVIEKCYEEIDGVAYSANFFKHPSEIYAKKFEYIICIKVYEDVADIYENIKKSIYELDAWDNIVETLCWFKALDLELSTFSIMVYDLEKTTKYLMRLDVCDNKVVKYTTLDDSDEICIENNGNWAIKHDDILIKYDEQNKKRYFFLPKDKVQNVNSMNEILNRAIELTTVMFRITGILDNILDGFSDQART